MAQARRAVWLRLESAFVWLLCAAPLALILWWGFTGDLTANPVEFVLRELGVWGLRFLCLTLAVTLLARYAGMPRLMRFRRRIGLWAFAYVTLHLLTYVAVAHEFDWAEIATDIAKRPYITIGMGAFALLVPLAVTSANAVRRKMTPRAWRRLHRSVYLIAAMGVVHYFLLVKADTSSPLLYGGIVAVLLAARLLPRFTRSRTA
ncbi:sulfite oxidase heme-binding subunit YedZ [Novosphingobium sp. ZW T3_23]|uniref:sulfite oxidase heme-binding subunit YedZ n=1 Tax=Novosphingobium sp. ZW T3_23 TaxID=3378084 RepID=UPI00385494D8